MTSPRVTGFISTSNYYSFDKTNENLTLLGGNIPLGKNTTLSLGVGNDWTTDGKTSENKPALEAKVKHNLNKNLNIQGRYRKIGGVDQARVTFGGKHSFNKDSSVYYAIHGTAKFKDGNACCNTGGWVGLSYKNVSFEFQQNVPLNKAAQSLGQTLGSFNDSNKMFSVFVTIPFKN